MYSGCCFLGSWVFGPMLWKSIWKETLFQGNSELSFLGKNFTFDACNEESEGYYLLFEAWNDGYMCEVVWRPWLVYAKLWLREFSSVLLNITKFLL